MWYIYAFVGNTDTTHKYNYYYQLRCQYIISAYFFRIMNTYANFIEKVKVWMLSASGSRMFDATHLTLSLQSLFSSLLWKGKPPPSPPYTLTLDYARHNKRNHHKDIIITQLIPFDTCQPLVFAQFSVYYDCCDILCYQLCVCCLLFYMRIALLAKSGYAANTNVYVTRAS